MTKWPLAFSGLGPAWDLFSGSSISKMVEEVFAIRSSNMQKSKGGSDTVSAKQFAKWARGYKGGLPCPFVVVLLDLQNNVQKIPQLCSLGGTKGISKVGF